MKDKNDSGIDFDPVAPFYSGRVPYIPAFFRAVVDRLALQKDSFIVDLACGTGDLANGFSPYCKSVLAVDKSEAMLSARSKVPPNVRFVQADLDLDPVPISEPADLVVIGRAIHHLDRTRLLSHLEMMTKTNAIVLICGAGLTANDPWHAAHRALFKRYSRSGIQRYQILGLDAFAGTRWKPSTAGIDVFFRSRWGVPEFFRHALSYSSASAAVSAAGPTFERELEEMLEPYWDEARAVEVEQVNWGVPYRRSNSDAG